MFLGMVQQPFSSYQQATGPQTNQDLQTNHQLHQPQEMTTEASCFDPVQTRQQIKDFSQSQYHMQVIPATATQQNMDQQQMCGKSKSHMQCCIILRLSYDTLY